MMFATRTPRSPWKIRPALRAWAAVLLLAACGEEDVAPLHSPAGTEPKPSPRPPAVATEGTSAAPSSVVDGESDDGAPGSTSAERRVAAADAAANETTGGPTEEAQAAEPAYRLSPSFPRHGLVLGLQPPVLSAPNSDAEKLGLLRVGARLPVGSRPSPGPGCDPGYLPVSPRGYVCSNLLATGDVPPESSLASAPAAMDAPRPYAYYSVRAPVAPEYHRLPTTPQRLAAEALARDYLEERKGEDTEVEAELLDELNRSAPSVVKRYLSRGFFVTGTLETDSDGVEYLRTVRGAYVKLSALTSRHGSDFQGIRLGPEDTLPVAFVVRGGQPLARLTDEQGRTRLQPDERAPPLPRLTPIEVPTEERIGRKRYYRLADGHYLRRWYVAIARAQKRPSGVAADEVWIHINLAQQTLVAYEGDRPVYATLVSTGLPEHATPPGLYHVRSKRVATTMSDVGPEVSLDARYSIEDVPWTQYFSGSLALHGAFWHDRFGLQRSHGCVNLAPPDAYQLFKLTRPELPPGWHGLFSTSAREATTILITES